MSMQGVVVALGGEKRFGTLITEVRPPCRDRPPHPPFRRDANQP